MGCMGKCHGVGRHVAVGAAKNRKLGLAQHQQCDRDSAAYPQGAPSLCCINLVFIYCGHFRLYRVETYHPPGRSVAMIPAEIADQLRALSGLAESEGRLTQEQLAILYNRGWFKLFVPRDLGGLELTLPDGVRLEEELAGIDGSLG